MQKIFKYLGQSFWFLMTSPIIAHAGEQKAGYDFGIEGMRSQSYSVGILVFLFISMAVFIGVIRLFYQHSDMSKIKTGEKVLMGLIVGGVVVAAIFAVAQLADGYLF